MIREGVSQVCNMCVMFSSEKLICMTLPEFAARAFGGSCAYEWVEVWDFIPDPRRLLSSSYLSILANMVTCLLVGIQSSGRSMARMGDMASRR